jgi:hypothetical protein
MPGMSTVAVNTSSITIPFCQLLGPISDGTDALQSPTPGLHSHTFASAGFFVSVMSPCGGETTGGSWGGCGGIGVAHVLPFRPKTNCRSLMSTTPSVSGKFTSYDGEYRRLPSAARYLLAINWSSLTLTKQSPLTSPSRRRTVSAAEPAGTETAAPCGLDALAFVCTCQASANGTAAAMSMIPRAMGRIIRRISSPPRFHRWRSPKSGWPTGQTTYSS